MPFRLDRRGVRACLTILYACPLLLVRGSPWPAALTNKPEEFPVRPSVTKLPFPSGRLRVEATAALIPRGTMSDDELAAETISELRWWLLHDVIAHRQAPTYSRHATWPHR